MEESFDDLKRILGTCHIEILRAPRGRHFILGDTPVVLIPPGGRKAQPFSKPLAIFDAQFLVMPVASTLALRLPVQRDAFVDIGHTALEEINRLQIANAHRYAYFAPNQRSQTFVHRLAEHWKPRSDVSDLVAR
jgi:hypothetical protein